MLEQVTETEVFWGFSNLKGSSSSGPDLVPIRVVKSIYLPAIVTPLTKLINRSFERGVFSQALKSVRAICHQKRW